MAEVEISLGGKSLANDYFEPICVLYDLVFSQPPFEWSDGESEDHRIHLSGMLEYSSFEISVATCDSKLVGFCYGIRLQSSTEWWAGLSDDRGVEYFREYEGRTFAIIDLAVHPDYRGFGHGRRLLSVLLGSRSEFRATLCVQPTALETQDIYKHLGWQYLGRKTAHPGSVSPKWDVYAIGLRDE